MLKQRNLIQAAWDQAPTLQGQLAKTLPKCRPQLPLFLEALARSFPFGTQDALRGSSHLRSLPVTLPLPSTPPALRDSAAFPCRRLQIQDPNPGRRPELYMQTCARTLQTPSLPHGHANSRKTFASRRYPACTLWHLRILHYLTVAKSLAIHESSGCRLPPCHLARSANTMRFLGLPQLCAMFDSLSACLFAKSAFSSSEKCPGLQHRYPPSLQDFADRVVTQVTPVLAEKDLDRLHSPTTEPGSSFSSLACSATTSKLHVAAQTVLHKL